MARYHHLLRTYARRLRWEIGAWVAVTLGCSILALTPAPAVVLAAAARIEWIVMLWLLLRICLADAAFGTLAGKQTRPLHRGEASLARLGLLGLAFLPALLLRAFVWARWATPELADLRQWASQDLALVIARTALLAAVLQGVAWLVRGIGSRKVVSAALLVLAALLTLWLAADWLKREPRELSYAVGYGGITTVDFPMFQVLPQGSVVLGSENYAAADEGSDRRELLVYQRMPFDARALGRSSDDVECRISGIRQRGSTLEATIHLRGLADRLDGLEKRMNRPGLLVNFADGTFGAAAEANGGRIRSPLALSPVDEILFKVRFPTPLQFSWNERSESELLEGAELWILRRGDELLPPPPDEPLRWEKRAISPEERQAIERSGFRDYTALVTNRNGSFAYRPVVPSEEEAGLATEVDACMSLLRNDSGDGRRIPAAIEGLREKGRRLVPHLLRWPAWSDGQWQGLVRPVLLAHARIEDRPELLARLREDPRLFEVFVEEGWVDEALPVMRERAGDRKDLPNDALMRLAAGANADAELCADLAAIAVRHWRGAGDLAPAFRRNPDFDWPSFVSLGWDLRKYGIHGSEDWLFARWAAELGDRSGLQRLVRGAAAGREWEAEQLPRLVPGAGENVDGFLRANLDRLVHDPDSGTWSVPR